MYRYQVISRTKFSKSKPRWETAKLHSLQFNTEAKQNFATHSDLSVEIKNKNYTSKVVRHLKT